MCVMVFFGWLVFFCPHVRVGFFFVWCVLFCVSNTYTYVFPLGVSEKTALKVEVEICLGAIFPTLTGPGGVWSCWSAGNPSSGKDG